MVRPTNTPLKAEISEMNYGTTGWERTRPRKKYMYKKNPNTDNFLQPSVRSAARHLHNHAEHHEDIPQGNEDAKISEAQQELSDIVT